MEEEMERGLLKKMPPVYAASTLIGLVVFPMLVRHPLTTVFLDGDDKRFDSFIEERKSFISDMMIRLLTPDK